MISPSQHASQSTHEHEPLTNAQRPALPSLTALSSPPFPLVAPHHQPVSVFDALRREVRGRATSYHSSPTSNRARSQRASRSLPASHRPTHLEFLIRYLPRTALLILRHVISLQRCENFRPKPDEAPSPNLSYRFLGILGPGICLRGTLFSRTARLPRSGFPMCLQSHGTAQLHGRAAGAFLAGAIVS